MSNLRTTLERRYPLTTLGTVVAAILLYLFGNAFRTASAYELAIALLGLGVPAALLIALRVQVRAFEAFELQLGLHGSPVAGRSSAPFAITGIDRRTALFTRVYAIARAELSQATGVTLRMRREAASTGKEPLVIRLPTPLSGRLGVRVTTELRDVFSLVRAPFGRSFERRELVLPGPPVGAHEYDIQTYAGAEEHRRHTSAEQERYYMREYTPGDRFRDINWKASSRLSMLLTRVSPHSEEPTVVVQIEIRHYRSAELPYSLEAVLHLEVLRAWVLWFMRSLASGRSAVKFQVRTADQVLEAENEDDLDRVAQSLAVLPYVPPRAEQPDAARAEGEWFVFSTPYDTGGRTRMRAAREHLFMTAPPGDNRERNHPVPLFPDRRLTALPGPWVLRRERRLPHPAVLQSGAMVETLSILPRVL